MSPPTPQPHRERENTDASLRAERTKTDAELATARRTAKEEADESARSAQERAEADRAAHDRTLADEQAVTDSQIRAEREERQRALLALLRLEREATDERLLVERRRADEVVATRDDFLGIVSHDLRTLLGGMALSAAMLVKHATEGEGDPETMKHAVRMQRFTARMNRLVGDLLDVVSLEAGKLGVTPEPQDAVRLVRETEEAFLPSFSAKGVELVTETAPGSILAKFDHDRILQVLANLLSNALKFTERGGRVAVSVAPIGSEVRFLVTDTGVGIPVDQVSAVFDRFRQVAPRDRRGLGLGLYISKCIVEAHGGTIWIERPEAGGTAVHFTLPAAGEDRQRGDAGSERLP